MDIKEQALDVLNKLKENNPAKFFNKVDETNAGMNFILLYLSENKNEAYASTIADKMNISRARVAVLIQKLINKKQIEKSVSNVDGRIEVLNITPFGLNVVNSFKEQVLFNVTTVIEKVGIEEIYKFIEVSAKIKNILDNLE